MELNFDLPEKDKTPQSLIKVIGVGGGGSNTLNNMYHKGIAGVDMLICNTDRQALAMSPIPYKIHLGQKLVQGLGAGGDPEVGQKAAKESEEEIREYLKSGHTQMLFITAGMGGGTGTGAAPVIARIAKEMDILVVGIVTTPFSFEGMPRKEKAKIGLEKLREYTDTLLIINNDKIHQILGNSGISVKKAFAYADDVLFNATRGIAEIITRPGMINVDFKDVKNVMTNGGTAIMGTATAEGNNRAKEAVEAAMSSPLLDNVDIRGARSILVNITGSEESLMLDEFTYINQYIQERAGGTADLFTGMAYDNNMGDKLSVTVIATGFNNDYKSSKIQINSLNIANKNTEESKNLIKNENSFKETFMVKDILTEEKNKEITINKQTSEIEKPTKSHVTIIQQKTEGIADQETQSMSKKKVFDLYGNETPEDNFEAEKEKLQREFENRLKSTSNNKSVDYKDQKILKELEDIPAYKRMGKDFSHQQEIIISGSKTILQEKVDPQTGEKKITLKENNSHLHDNVD
ncbi:MAG: cell division protein FtsZ [Bacteroidia bacterium]|nr:cell division protein FtsZ [Bacteroidia bacterium]MDW8347279.1 cell division protein FtsZ [Bacteroidia bacterium]